MTARTPGLSGSPTSELWERGVIPGSGAPDGLRIGLSPLSTSFTEVVLGLSFVEQLLAVRSRG